MRDSHGHQDDQPGDTPDALGRRSFLKTGLLAAGATALGESAGVARAAEEAAPDNTAPAAIPVRAFGKTGRELPILAMGGSAMAQRFIAAYGAKLLSEEERIEMVRYAYDRGVRYFDTARVYGESEGIMGRGLEGVRENCFIATKVAHPDPNETRASLEKSLEELRTDYVDSLQIHSPAIERVGYDGAMKIYDQVAKLRDEGLVKHIGLTTHIAFETVLKMIETGGFDQVLLAYGYFRKGMDTMLSNRKIEYRELCLAKAHELGMGIVAMKVLGANIMSHNAPNLLPEYSETELARLPAAAIRWTASDDRVSMLNIGVTYPSDIDKNIATLTSDLTYTNDDRALLGRFCREAYECETVKALKVT